MLCKVKRKATISSDSIPEGPHQNDWNLSAGECSHGEMRQSAMRDCSCRREVQVLGARIVAFVALVADGTSVGGIKNRY